MTSRATAGQADRFLQFYDRFVVHMFLEVGLAELIMGETEIGIHFDRLAALPYRFVIEMRKDKKLCQVGVNDQRQRIQVRRSFSFPRSLRRSGAIEPDATHTNGARLRSLGSVR